MFTVEVGRKAEKFLDRLMLGNRSAGEEIIEAMQGLATNPRPPGCEKLRGKSGGYRIKAGSYRILYRINENKVVVDVFQIGHRREVYQSLRR